MIRHNKTLAAQLYEEFKELFPHNAVGYFVSYYDYYQPEAYIPQRDIYIEKDASRNDDLDRLRLAATSNLVSRKDVLLVASVSCIFGLGFADRLQAKRCCRFAKGVPTDRDEMLRKLIDLQYSRNDIDFKRGDVPRARRCGRAASGYEEFAYRIEFFGDEITSDRRDQSADRRIARRAKSRSSFTRRCTMSCRKSAWQARCSRFARNWICR